jgi:hypothetical protein
MKKKNIIAVIATICSSIASINAYENSFFNNTQVPIGIAIQYTSNDSIEPLYKQLVKPNAMITFSPGKATTPFSSNKREIPAIKWGFCLDNIFYAENPTTEQTKHNFQKAIWRKIPITWVEEKSITKRSEKKSPKKRIPLRREKPIPSAEKSLCRDRHFDILRNEHGKIMITSSLNE